MRVPLALAFFVIILSILIDIYIYLDIRKACRKRFWSRFYAVTSVLLWAFLIVVLCLPKRSEDSGIIGIMWMLYSYLTVYLSKLIYVLSSLAGRLVSKIFRLRLRFHPARIAGVVLAVAFFGVIWAGVFFTRRHIEVNRVEIASPKVSYAFSGYRIAQLSDLHVGTWGNDTTFISALVDSVNALHPDLIVFTGDIVNRKTEELLPFVAPLSRLKAKDGVLSILGNHDYGDYVDWALPEDREDNNRRLAEVQRGMGWTLLNNERRFVTRDNDSVMIVGVENWGDSPFPVYGDLDKALPASPDSAFHQNDRLFKILLTHNPEHWNQEVSKKTNIDLSLSGHTHAMQIMLSIGGWRWSPAAYRYEQWGGLYERPSHKGDPSRLYVNIGAGEVGMPARLLDAYPEITLITLQHLPYAK